MYFFHTSSFICSRGSIESIFNVVTELHLQFEIRIKESLCRSDTATDYQEEVLPLLEKDGGRLFNATKMTLDHFRVAASWIGSRAFGVDDYHGGPF